MSANRMSLTKYRELQYVCKKHSKGKVVKESIERREKKEDAAKEEQKKGGEKDSQQLMAQSTEKCVRDVWQKE